MSAKDYTQDRSTLTIHHTSSPITKQAMYKNIPVSKQHKVILSSRRSQLYSSSTFRGLTKLDVSSSSCIQRFMSLWVWYAASNNDWTALTVCSLNMGSEEELSLLGDSKKLFPTQLALLLKLLLPVTARFCTRQSRDHQWRQGSIKDWSTAIGVVVAVVVLLPWIVLDSCCLRWTRQDRCRIHCQEWSQASVILFCSRRGLSDSWRKCFLVGWTMDVSSNGGDSVPSVSPLFQNESTIGVMSWSDGDGKGDNSCRIIVAIRWGMVKFVGPVVVVVVAVLVLLVVFPSLVDAGLGCDDGDGTISDLFHSCGEGTGSNSEHDHKTSNTSNQMLHVPFGFSESLLPVRFSCIILFVSFLEDECFTTLLLVWFDGLRSFTKFWFLVPI